MKGENNREILSVGIDVGTTTTQMVASRILVCNTAPGAAVPRVAIAGKEILYRSDIHFTPFLNRKLIDARGVKEIIAGEYRRAGISPARVDTGAVIVTGETARKENARALVEALAEFAGNFVVAAAGPIMESIIAGKGAGAAALSRDLHRVVINIDVGGGTSNLAVFEEGLAVDATCIHTGGRLLELEPGGDLIRYISPAAVAVLEACGLELQAGQRISLEQLRVVAGTMAGAVRELLEPSSPGHLGRRLIMGPPLRLDYPPGAVTLSGGVADFVYRPGEISSVNEGSRYGDIGPFLGEALRTVFAGERWELLKPAETIRATVIGAGCHTMNLSGNTVAVSPGFLPLRNVPVVKPFSGEPPSRERELAWGLARLLAPYRAEGFNVPLAIALKGPGGAGFRRIQELAESIAAATAEYIKSGQPLILLLEEDCAKVLGQTLAVTLGKKAGIICLDQLAPGDGDYIDICEPIMDGTVVPVIIKTLVFDGH